AGEPPEWAEEVDWGMVEAKAKTEIPKGMTYKLSWDSPRRAETAKNQSTTRKKPPKPAAPPV
ncbi:MAG: hypothetical protein LBD44_03745, partial [Spirochaetaceae bacterium]|nr:hypothetical protein [Spirochaetaceae bacterium]